MKKLIVFDLDGTLGESKSSLAGEIPQDLRSVPVAVRLKALTNRQLEGTVK
jgi:phosphoglycolate phosphatase-like HAD superfamily hydrolase